MVHKTVLKFVEFHSKFLNGFETDYKKRLYVWSCNLGKDISDTSSNLSVDIGSICQSISVQFVSRYRFNLSVDIGSATSI